MRRSTMLKFVVSTAAGFAAAFGAQAQQPPAEVPIINLGDRQQDRSYPLMLVAQNLNCNSPQDFRFDLREAPFVIALEDPVVRNLPPGGQGSIPAQLLFGNVGSGEQEAVVTTICETCGKGPFGNRCRADKQQVILRVNVIADDPPQPPAQTAQTQPATTQGAGAPADTAGSAQTEIGARGPAIFTRGQCLADVSVNLAAGLEGFLTSEQQRKLDDARKKAKAANEAQAAAYDDLDDKRRKKKKCDDELAALKAEQAAKQAAADAAAAAADAAQGAAGDPAKGVADAEKKLADYDKDVADAQKALDRANNAAKAQEKAFLATAKPGASPSAVEAAAQNYKDASKAQDEAKAALDAVKASKAEREAALAAAQQKLAAAQAAAAAKKAEADAAKAAAAAADAAVAAKEKECLKAAEAVGAQEVKVDNATRAAQSAGAGLTRAEDAAAGQAAKNLDQQIACQKEECERLRKKWKEHFRRLANAKKALEDLNYFTEGPAPPPDELWNSYLELGYTKFMEGAQAAVESLGEEFLPTTVAGVAGTALDVLEAAYGIAKVAQASLTPGTYAHGRTEGETLQKWLQDKNYAHTDQGDQDAKAVEDQMERLMKDPNVIAKDLDTAMKEMADCEKKIADMEATRDAAKK